MDYYYKGPCQVKANISRELVHFYKLDTNTNMVFVDEVGRLLHSGKRVWFVYNDWGFAPAEIGLAHLVEKYRVTEFSAGADLHIYLLLDGETGAPDGKRPKQ